MKVQEFPLVIHGERVLIANAGELAAALDVLQGQYDREALEQLKPHLVEILRGPDGLAMVLKNLIPEHQIFLFQALGRDLVNVVGTPESLSRILSMLSEHYVEKALITLLGSRGLRKIIHTPDELASVLEWIYGRLDELVLSLVGEDFLCSIFQNGYELSLVLYSLEHESQARLIKILGWERIVAMIHSREDLAYLIRALPARAGFELLQKSDPDKIRSFIRDSEDLEYLHRYMEQEESQLLKKILEEKNAQ